MKKPKGLTIAILAGKSSKDRSGDPMESESSDSMEPPMDDSEDEEEESELPQGLVEAVTEFGEALDERNYESAAKALRMAITCCEEC